MGYHLIARKKGHAKWAENCQETLGFPMEIVSADRTMAELAGEIKVSNRMSLADCFAAALAKQRDCEIYTGDPEFRALEPDWKIVWI